MPQKYYPRSEVWTRRRAVCKLSEQRVLVVDDYIDTADALCTSLLVHGFDARAAYSGCEALQIATAWRPHTIILDIAMPDLSGLAVATAVRQMPSLSDCLLVAYTAQGRSDYKAIRDSGFDAVCAKPASPKWLVRLLESLAAPAGGQSPLDVVRRLS
nr:Response regulator MprA [Paraburkholderia busanensis]